MELNNYIVDVLKYSCLTKEQASSVKSQVMQVYHQFSEESKKQIQQFLHAHKNTGDVLDQLLLERLGIDRLDAPEVMLNLSVLIFAQARMVIDKLRRKQQQAASRKVVPIKKAE